VARAYRRTGHFWPWLIINSVIARKPFAGSSGSPGTKRLSSPAPPGPIWRIVSCVERPKGSFSTTRSGHATRSPIERPEISHGPADVLEHAKRSVDTWELALCIDQERNGVAFHSPAFTGDGRLMALGIAPDQVLLADVAAGRELARLTTLRSVTPTPLVFSPDGTMLIARTDQETVLVRNLVGNGDRGDHTLGGRPAPDPRWSTSPKTLRSDRSRSFAARALSKSAVSCSRRSRSASRSPSASDRP
jgi:hypothetical protein